MRLLILGGTVFLGRHAVESARRRGHEVTIFTRGQRNPDLFPDVERLRGDRDGGLEALRGRRWDAVLDTSGYVPRVVGASAGLLADRVGHYTFISTISVYADASVPGITEASPVGTLADESVETVGGETYGPLKALCESAVERALPGRALVIRPGLIVGPHDPTDRFTYWPRRVARGGEVLAPAPPDRPVQFIDARDLADWAIRMAEERRIGTFNATGPDTPLTMGQFLDAARDASGSDARVTWVAGQFLLDHGATPWIEVPLWTGEGEGGGLLAVDCRKAFAAGLTFRPLADTIRDTIAWDAARPADTERRAGLAPEKEAELLQAWHGRGV